MYAFASLLRRLLTTTAVAQEMPIMVDFNTIAAALTKVKKTNILTKSTRTIWQHCNGRRRKRSYWGSSSDLPSSSSIDRSVQMSQCSVVCDTIRNVCELMQTIQSTKANAGDDGPLSVTLSKLIGRF